MKLVFAVVLLLAPAGSSGATLPALPAVPSSPVTLPPISDTWVSAALPDTSYGNSEYLSVENNSSTMERSYLKFDASSLAGQTVSSAVLKVWVIRDNSGGGVTDIFELYPIYTFWSSSLTYTQSAILSKGAMVTSVPSTDYPAGNPAAPNDTVPPQALTFDITSLAQSWASGGANEGLVIQFQTAANADYRFGSMDNSDPALRPVLTVTASASAPPPSLPPPSSGSGSGSGGGKSSKRCGCSTVGGVGEASAFGAALLAGLFGFTRRRPRA